MASLTKTIDRLRTRVRDLTHDVKYLKERNEMLELLVECSEAIKKLRREKTNEAGDE